VTNQQDPQPLNVSFTLRCRECQRRAHLTVEGCAQLASGQEAEWICPWCDTAHPLVSIGVVVAVVPVDDPPLLVSVHDDPPETLPARFTDPDDNQPKVLRG
jgi:hypothetical protein